jgi:hypothetical protein
MKIVNLNFILFFLNFITLIKFIKMENKSEDSINEQKKTTSWIPYYDFMSDLTTTFDSTSVYLLIAQNINQGMWGMVLISVQDLFKQYLKLDPGLMTYYTTIIGLPWSIKIIYGLISDNVPILGYKRKSYIIMMGLI